MHRAKGIEFVYRCPAGTIQCSGTQAICILNSIKSVLWFYANKTKIKSLVLCKLLLWCYTLEEIVPVHPVEEIVILITVNLGRVKKSDIILLVARIKLICGYLQWHSMVFKAKV